MTTATKNKSAKRASRPKPATSEAATKAKDKQDKALAAARRAFVVGSEVEFHLREGEPRAQGDATILKLDEPTKGQAQMAMLDVQCIVAGDPDKVRNPDGELWAMVEELFPQGTREANGNDMECQPVAKMAVGGDDPMNIVIETDSPRVAEALTQTVRVGDVEVQVSDRAAKVLAGAENQGTEAVVPPSERGGLLAAAQLLHNATGGRCDVVLLAGHRKHDVRMKLAAMLLGREPSTPRDDVSVTGIRFLFRQQMEIEDGLTGDAADERIAELAIQLVDQEKEARKASKENGKAKAKIAKAGTDDQSHEEPNAATEAAQQASAPAADAGEQHTAHAAEDDYMNKAAERARKRATKKGGGKSSSPKAPAGNGRPAKTKKEAGEKKMSLLDAAAQILARRTNAMTAKELVQEAQSRGLWSSPNGKTPEATLNAALHREINTKGKESRFTKPEAGKFLAK